MKNGGLYSHRAATAVAAILNAPVKLNMINRGHFK